ncbi:MAG TPA: PP2C family protein-serine/threonine phosphatase [Novimethylophilus sp.]|jgi:serine phosphatase RsbU (regulator of sigma subunit)|uniref:PP2C family protein-serine/threonine phosphatase n=1 Tax=Novimethylophilus sp. TaxID=2137426 RepID=UPI002F415323
MPGRLIEWLEQKKSAGVGFIDPGLEACSQIAGNNAFAMNGFEVPGLGCHLLSIPLHGEKAGGDIHYVAVCGQRMKSKFLLIDTMGHGEAAAWLSDKLLETMGALAGSPGNHLLLEEINRLIHNGARSPLFATVAAATYNQTDHSWTYAYAGHPGMLLKRKGQWSELHAGGYSTFAVGVVRDFKYYETTTTLEPGDWVLMYTDGVLDAVNPDPNYASRKALLDVATMVEAETPDDFFTRFVEKLVDMNHSPGFDEDLTMILIDHR